MTESAQRPTTFLSDNLEALMKALDRLIPPALRASDERSLHQTRVVVATTVTALTFTPILLAVTYSGLSSAQVAVVCGAWVGFAAALPTLWWTASARAAGHLIVATLACYFLASISIEGALSARNISAGIAVAVGGIFCGAAETLAWTTVTSGGALTLALVGRDVSSAAMLSLLFGAVVQWAFWFVTFVFVRQKNDAITALDRANRQLHLKDLTMDHAADAILWSDEKGNFVYANDQACESLGYSRDELLRLNISDVDPLHPPEQLPQVLAELRALAGKHYIESRHRRKDGTVFPVEICVTCHEQPEGPIFASFVRDLTERLEAEDRLRELVGELAHFDRLSSMGEMVTAIAHELNQPLTAISNDSFTLAESSRSGVDSTELTDLALQISERALLAGQVVHGIRAFLGKRPTRRREVDLNELVRATYQLFDARLRHDYVRSRMDLCPTPLLVRVDPVQIQQVLVNLVQNSVDAMKGRPHEQRHLRIASREGEKGDPRIYVEDSGCGIAGDRVATLFKPFESSKRNGLGIGLSISRAIAESHAGELRLRSTSNDGSCFCLRLPAARGVAP